MNKEDQYKFLLECNQDLENGYLKWNKWRSENNIQSPILDSVDLSGRSFKLYNFAGGVFNSSILSNTIFIHCDFMLSEMEGIEMMNSNCGFSNFTKANMQGSNLTGTHFTLSQMVDTNLSGANFLNGNLSNTFMIKANLENSVFENATLMMPNLANSNLQGAVFNNCALSGANFSNSNLNNCTITNCIVFGVSVWNISTEGLIQENLTITNHKDQSIITVDDIEIAQFIYLISNNKKVSNAIDTITSKVVLILGRFSTERLRILRVIKDKIKEKGYVPILFDFDGPQNRDLTETIGLIGRLSKFVVADLTDAKSIPQELSELVPNNPSIIFQPVLLKDEREYSMFEHWQKYPWVREIFEYENDEDLKSFFDDETNNIIDKKKT